MGLRAFTIALIMFGIAILGWLFAVILSDARARDLDGHYAASDPHFHAWFDSLSSGKGMCCSFADGRSVADPDWGTEKAADGSQHYWVVVDGERLTVPDNAVVTEPNRFGPAVVWPYRGAAQGGDEIKTQIRCFIAGAGM